MTTVVKPAKPTRRLKLAPLDLPPFPEFVRRHWARVACAHVDPEIFWPVSRDSTRQVQIARAVCAGCPLRAECEEHAIEHEPHGIWAGLTEDERRQIRQQRGLG